MAQVAYELERFAPAKRKHETPRVRVAKRQRSAQQKQFFKMLRTLLGVLFMLVLVCGVLYTQAMITELGGQINDKKQELKEEETLNVYLNFEMDNKTSLKNIEERAVEMGLSKMGNGQVTYFKVGESDGIQVRDNPFTQILQRTRDGLLSIWDYISP